MTRNKSTDTIPAPAAAAETPRPAPGFVRALSVIAAFAVMALVVLYPRAIAEDGASVPHGSFVLLMMGMSVCYIVGFGFVPQTKILRFLFSPYMGWALMAAGLVLVFG